MSLSIWGRDNGLGQCDCAGFPGCEGRKNVLPNFSAQFHPPLYQFGSSWGRKTWSKKRATRREPLDGLILQLWSWKGLSHCKFTHFFAFNESRWILLDFTQHFCMFGKWLEHWQWILRFVCSLHVTADKAFLWPQDGRRPASVLVWPPCRDLDSVNPRLINCWAVFGGIFLVEDHRFFGGSPPPHRNE